VAADGEKQNYRKRLFHHYIPGRTVSISGGQAPGVVLTAGARVLAVPLVSNLEFNYVSGHRK
jgi:hypothetical protein